jgi:hypothetical protein
LRILQDLEMLSPDAMKKLSKACIKDVPAKDDEVSRRKNEGVFDEHSRAAGFDVV